MSEIDNNTFPQDSTSSNLSFNSSIPSLEEQCYIFKMLFDSPYSITQEKKARVRLTPFQMLYQIYLLHKNVEKKRWKKIFPSIATLAKWAKISPRSVCKFLQSPMCSFFIKVKRKPFMSNEYELHQWAIDFFKLLERIGVMKEFKIHNKKWRNCYKRRIELGIVPLAQKGLEIQEVMNKLSTKRPRKVHTVDPLKVHTTTSPLGSGTTPSGDRSNYESPLPVVRDFSTLSGDLVARFHIREGDVNMVMRNFSLNEMRRGYELLRSWKKNGMEIKSPCAAYLSAIKKQKTHKKKRGML